MSEAMRRQRKSSEWLQNVLRMQETLKTRRREQWEGSFTAAEAELALSLSKVRKEDGSCINSADLITLTLGLLDVGALTPRYPAWQFEPVVLRYLPALQGALATMDQWTRHFFFIERNELLGMTPLNALRAGMHRQVFAAALAANEDY